MAVLKRLSLFICFLCIISVASCADKTSSSNNAEWDPDGILYTRLSGEPTFLNPILYTDAYSGDVIDKIFSGLFKINEKLELEPDLVESYTIGKDKMTYTFKLKQGIKWHDGAPFTAEDVKFTFDKILDPTTNTVRRSNFIIDGKPVVFKLIDRYTFQTILPKPYAPFLVRVSMEILPKHLLENVDINITKFNQNPIGTGPFIFKTWKTGQYVQVERNKNYYGKTPKLKGIIFKIMADTNTAKVALEKGEIDVSGLQPKDYIKLKNHKNLNLFQFDDLHYSYMAFNLKHPVFKDLRIRQAIAYAINKKPISHCLADELVGALQGTGRTISQRDQLHKLAEANRA